ncbi:MAG TPA: hypothetical protein VF808_07960 [Ktedonobacterales bacterium]
MMPGGTLTAPGATEAHGHLKRGETPSSQDDVQIRGWQLVAARLAWLFLFVTSMWDFAVGISIYHAQALHPCVDPSCPVTPAQAETLRGLGINLGRYANASAGVAAALVVISAILALALFWRRSDTVISLAVGVFLVTFPIGNLTTGMTFTLISPVVDTTIGLVNLAIAFSVFLIFPDGRFVPRWTWLLVMGWVGLHIALAAYPNVGWLDAFYPVIYLSALGVLVYRYRRVSNQRRRQQTKIVVLGFITLLLSNQLYWTALPFLIPALNAPGSLYTLIGYPIYLLVALCVPVSFAVAIQRHQLFDVDVLINRALVYGSLTFILASLYFGLVIGAQTLIRLLTGQTDQSQLVIVLSTLLIAALVQPLRRGLQMQIDRRFYRSKYDAAQTLARFGAKLRSEVELDELRDHLLAVVEETMQPERISLWLRQVGSHEWTE